MVEHRTIVADPPWPYRNPGEFTTGGTAVARGAGSHARYGSMSIADICALAPPVADDAHLYLWTTNAFVCEAHEVAEAWGFRVITMCTWVKTTEAPIDKYCAGCKEMGCPVCGAEVPCHKHEWEGKVGLPVGMVRASPRSGYYFKGATEHCLFGVRGKGGRKWLTQIPTAWLWPRAPHSAKPDAFYDMVERVSPAPRLELFARRNRLGWDTFGDEAIEHVKLGS